MKQFLNRLYLPLERISDFQVTFLGNRRKNTSIVECNLTLKIRLLYTSTSTSDITVGFPKLQCLDWLKSQRHHDFSEVANYSFFSSLNHVESP